MEARVINVFWFKKKSPEKRDDSEFENKLAQIDERQESADIKIEIATIETENLNKLIKKARDENNATLKLYLAMGGDRRIGK